jgi:glutamine synthetase
MELMRQIAVRHDLSCLLHEKPFKGINGSGKHCNWSLITDTGINLLDPTDTPENNLHFLVIITAILNAVHEHSALLRASIGSYSNDYRLGGHEAPPAIISVYLGGELENVLHNISEKGAHTRSGVKNTYDLGLHVGPELARDNTDRNRTSPFAFTGNKFEFRAVGSSASPSFPMTVLNAIVAESLNRIIDEIEKKLEGHKPATKQALFEAVLPVIRKYLKASKPIQFSGDNYSDAWSKEAKRRGLPIIKKSIDALEALKLASTQQAFRGILTPHELKSRYDILVEAYCHQVNIEMNLMIDLFRTQVLPIAIKEQKQLAEAISAFTALTGAGSKLSLQLSLLKDLGQKIDKAMRLANELEKIRQETAEIANIETRGRTFCKEVLQKAEALRESVDALEVEIDDSLWLLPKYREMLFIN